MQDSEAKTNITEDVEIVGSIKSSANIRFDGRLNGDMTCSTDAVIGQSANVKGNISVNSITVMGQITGNITAKDRIELKSTAKVNGDIRSKRLTVEDGVTFVGKSEVNPSGTSAARPASGGSSVHEIAPEENQEQAGDAKSKSGGLFGKK